MGTPIRLEAENFDLTTFGVEANDIASGDSLISLLEAGLNERGKAQTTLNIEGTYDVFIGYYDESDGQGQLGVKLNGTTLKYWSLNKDLGDSSADGFYRRQLGSDLAIATGQKLEISGFKKDSEDVRIDYIEFVPTGETANQPQPGELSFGGTTYSLNEDGTATSQITVTRSNGSDGNVSAMVQLNSGTATAADYVAGEILVSFTPGETTKTVTLPIVDDNLVESDESLSISLVNPSGGATLGSQTQATVTITDNDVPSFPSGETITLEAEALTLSSNYQVEDSPIGGKVVSLQGGVDNDTGTISTTLSFTGTYDVFLTYYDENDGNARFETKIGDLDLDDALLNEDLGTNWMFAGNRVRRQVGSSITISAGSNFEITGFEDGGEYARLDKIEFVPATPSGNQESIRLEVEDMSLVGYEVESNSLPSNGQLVSLKGDSDDSTGSAQQQLNFSGVFDVYVGYYDENDGNSELTINLAGNQLDRWTLDQQLGSNWISAGNGVRRKVASEQAVNAGQILEILGQEENGEYARVDYVEFVPVNTTGNPPSEPEPEPKPAPEPEPEPAPAPEPEPAPAPAPEPAPEPEPVPAPDPEPNPPGEPIRIEAEDLTLEATHRIQANPDSSGGELISFAGGASSERGTARTSLNLDGVYDVIIGYYDQSDGTAQMSVTLGEDKLKYWVLNRDLGTPDANGNSFIRRELAQAQVITPGTSLEVYGLEKDGDSAAVDYVEFVPVDLSTRPGRLEFSQASYIANENGSSAAQVTINRIAGNGGTVTTTLSLTGDTATAGSDFNSDPITVTFAPGEETKTVFIPIFNDVAPEFTERLTLQLSAPSGGATLGDIAQAQFTIVDDEENLEPRLYIGDGKVDEIKAAIQVAGSHHQLAFAAMQARVDQNDWQVYDENLNDGNKNYARTWLAREASMMYQLTDNPVYAQTAYEALRQVYDDPGFTNANITSEKGLTRAMVALGFAISYDWAAKAWTPEQRAWVKGKLVEGLDSWESFSHPNVRPPYASNWTAVTRGAEIVTMLALGEEAVRSDRYELIKNELNQHILNGYGQYGYNQEGNGYLTYGGSVLATAVNALRSTGDTDLDVAFESKEFWKLPLYGSVFNADQDSVQYGVGNVRFNAEGWTSFMFADVPEGQEGYYKFAYDLARGVNNPAEDGNKFEDKRAGTTWSLIYYPTENVTALDPDSNPDAFQPLLASDDKGGYFLRNRWQDADDTIVSLIGDFKSEPNAWNQPEAFNIGLYAYGDRFIAGPKGETNASAFSTLLIDGQIPNQTSTGQREFYEANATGGYVIVDGGSAYNNLGINSAKRHLDVEFNPDGSTLLSTLDKVRDNGSHDYTWQINVGESLDDGGISVTTSNEGGLKTFLLTSEDGDYVKGWVLEPSNVTLSAGDPLQITTTGVNTDLWVAMLTGQGNAPTANVVGSGLDAVLTVGNNQVSYDASSDRIISTNLGAAQSNQLQVLSNSLDSSSLTPVDSSGGLF